MKTPEEMAEYFRSMPSKKRENPYWEFDSETESVKTKLMSITPGVGEKPFSLEQSVSTILMVREFFRRFYESFHTEAQVLCVTREDGEKLNKIGIPVLGQGEIGPYEVTVMVLPQDNHMGTSVIGESLWQERIVNAGIVPILRIHSHHMLDPYQSGTDYSTLNSGTLEMVIGKIFNEELHLCYWLDVPGTDTKAQTFVVTESIIKEDGGERSKFVTIPRVFHSAVKPVDSGFMSKFEPGTVDTGSSAPDRIGGQLPRAAKSMERFKEEYIAENAAEDDD